MRHNRVEKEHMSNEIFCSLVARMFKESKFLKGLTRFNHLWERWTDHSVWSPLRKVNRPVVYTFYLDWFVLYPYSIFLSILIKPILYLATTNSQPNCCATTGFQSTLSWVRFPWSCHSLYFSCSTNIHSNSLSLSLVTHVLSSTSLTSGITGCLWVIALTCLLNSRYFSLSRFIYISSMDILMSKNYWSSSWFEFTISITPLVVSLTTLSFKAGALLTLSST